MNFTACPKCGGETRVVTISKRTTKECNHCGRLPFRDGGPEWGRSGFVTPPIMSKARLEEALYKGKTECAS
jgi:hypothetical protein